MSREFKLREKILMLILAVLLLIYGYYMIIIKPVSEGIEAAKSGKANIEAQMVIEQAKAAKLKSMKKALEEIDQADKPAISEIARYDNLSNVVESIDSALDGALSYNLVFNPVTFKGQIAYRAIDISFNCETYSAARKIINALNNSPYRCKITALNISANAGGDVPRLDKNPVTAKLTIVYYELVG